MHYGLAQSIADSVTVGAEFGAPDDSVTFNDAIPMLVVRLRLGLRI